MEVWKQIKDYPCYMVSDLGRVKSLKFDKEKILKGGIDTRGYRMVPLRNDKGRKTILIHRIVAFAFLDIVDGKNCVNHKDGNKTNNVLNNLEWCTQKENVKHSYQNGLCKSKEGNSNGRALLDEKKVLEIRSKQTSKVCDLAREYNVSWSCIKSIILKQTWTHI